jgi:hypothetical protein
MADLLTDQGLEYLKAGQGICTDPAALRYHPHWPLGVDSSHEVAEAGIQLPRHIRRARYGSD